MQNPRKSPLISAPINRFVSAGSALNAGSRIAYHSTDTSARFDNAKVANRNRDDVICCIVVDAEEDFDWLEPAIGIRHSVSNMMNTKTLQDLTEHYGAGPTYLLTYPVLESSEAVASLRNTFNNGRCDLGVQLHTWVTPPFDEHVEKELSKQAYSFAGNLPARLEAEKLKRLKAQFEVCFGFSPTMYRSGRYGIGHQTPGLIESLGFEIDTSISPRTDFSHEAGPNFANFPYQPFWFGQNRALFELPLCREVVGWSCSMTPNLYHVGSNRLAHGLRIATALSLTRVAERITLSPEGNDLSAMKRLVRNLYKRGCRTFAISFHSSSLKAGVNPYVKSKADLHVFYDRLSGILDFLRYSYNARLIRLRDMPLEFCSR